MKKKKEKEKGKKKDDWSFKQREDKGVIHSFDGEYGYYKKPRCMVGQDAYSFNCFHGYYFNEHMTHHNQCQNVLCWWLICSFLDCLFCPV